MDGMAMNKMGAVKEFPELFRHPRRIDGINGIHGLTRGQVMGSGSDAADPGNDPGKFLHGPSQTEDLESPQLRDLEVRIFHIPLVIQKDFNFPVSFQSGDRID